MIKRSTIFYFCPDFPQPSGGIKTLYRHVWRLNQLGFNASIVHQKAGFTLDWHRYAVPVTWLEQKPTFRPQDVLVFPEVMIHTIRHTSHFQAKRVVFALSWQPAYSRLKAGERWQDHGISQVLTKSPTVKKFLAWSMEIEATLIPEFVDPDLYRYAPPEKKNKICYLTRKDQSGSWLQGVFMRKGAPFSNFEWKVLRQMNESTYASHLREARVYVATNLQEGMHVSILEAMASGALVVGFSGVGGRDYMVGTGAKQNCVLVENGDLLALGKALEQILRQLSQDPQAYEGIIRRGCLTSDLFQDPQREEKALSTFFESVQQQPKANGARAI